MTSKERVIKAIRRQPVDRIPFTDAPWKETITRWRKEGLPEEKHPNDYFEFDIRYSYFLDTSPMIVPQELEYTERYTIRIDQYGRKIKELNNISAPPQVLSWAVNSQEDWRKIKARFTPSLNRVSLGYWGDYYEDLRPSGEKNVINTYNELENPEDTFVLLNTLECYETAMRLVGDEKLLLMMATEFDLVKDIFSTIAKTIIETAEKMFTSGMKFDGAFFAGDIAYKNGLLFSPVMYRELLMPFHKQVFSFFKSKGIPVFYHTDGNCNEAIDDLIGAGIDVLQPLEVKAGMDLKELKERWGNSLSFMGNIDIRAILGDNKKMLLELNSKLPLGLQGGYIYHSDHSIPPEVSFEKFSLLVQTVKETR